MSIGRARRRWGALVLVCALGSIAGSAQAAYVERERRVAAAELVDAALLTGPGFRVDPEAQLSGLQARFLIHTDWGPLQADSVEMLGLRIGEMAALSTVYSHGFGAALKRSGIEEVSTPLNQATAIGKEPVQRLKRLPQGVLRYFGQRLQRWADRARRLGDRADRAIGNAGSPAAGFGIDAGARDEIDEPWWDMPVDEVGRLLRSESGHGRARRALARALQVDPGSSNPLLRDRLDKLAWAIAGQRLAYDYALSLAAPLLADVIGELGRAEQITGLPPEEDQRRANELRLERWSSDPDLRYGLAWRGSFSPALLDQLLDELEALAPVGGGEAALDVAWLARSELEARFVLNSLRLLRAPHVGAANGGELVPVGALLGYRDPGGEFFLPLPVDRLLWLKEVRGWFDHHRITEHPRRSVLVSGDYSTLAQRAITRRGWSLLGRVRYPGAPLYRSTAQGA